MKFKLYCGDSVEVLKKIPSRSVHCCVTSPPYFGLRDYQNEGQIGREESPVEYIKRLVEVFREVRRVLKDSGTCWIVINDSYASRSGKNYKRKNLIGIPWILAFALRDDGWIWRSNIIWFKRSCLTESVKDRPSGCHEYILLFSKKEKYYYDYKAILEPYSPETIKQINAVYKGKAKKDYGATKAQDPSSTKRRIIEGLAKRGGRNKRSVWEVNRGISKSQHTATYPEALIVPCVLAGCPVGGIVLDPFIGSGTTAVVAVSNDRRAVGIDISLENIEFSRKRITEKINQK